MIESNSQCQHRQGLSANVPKKLQHIVPMFLQNRQNDVKTLIAALDREDFETIQSIGHKMKGSGAGYGFSHLTEIGIQLETCASRQHAEAIQKSIAELSEYLENVEIKFS